MEQRSRVNSASRTEIDESKDWSKDVRKIFLLLCRSSLNLLPSRPRDRSVSIIYLTFDIYVYESLVGNNG